MLARICHPRSVARPLAMHGLTRGFNELFESVLGDFPSFRLLQELAIPATPALNAYDGGEALHVEVELPGVREEEIDIKLESNTLTIRTEGNQEEKPEDRRYHRREYAREASVRTLKVPTDVDATRIEAKLQDGVLHLTLPKSETARPRRIEVRSQPSAKEERS